MTDVVDAIAPEVEAFETGDLFTAAGEALTDRIAEMQLLGYLIDHPAQVDEIIDEVKSDDFCDRFHARIFAVLVQQGWGIGMAELVQALGGDSKAKIFGDMTAGQYLASLMANADPMLDIHAAAERIQTLAEKRAIGDADDVDWNEPFHSTMGLRLWSEQNAPGPETEYIVEDLIPQGQMVLLIGETQTGKSFLATHLGAAIARGVPFFGRKVLEPMGVIWCAYEAATGAPARMRGYTKANNLDVEDLPFAALQQPLTLWPNLDNVTKLIAEFKGIEKHCFRGRKLGLIVVDTYNTGTPGASEIDSEVVSKIRAAFHHIIRETGAALMIVGHVNAAGKHRGNEQIVNNADTVLKVSRKVRTVNREVMAVRDDDRREIRTLRIVKQREGQDGDEHDFVLRVVEDGTKNKYGKARTTCVVANPNIADVGDDAEPGAGRGNTSTGVKVSKMESIFLNCILESLDEHGIAPPPELGLPRGIGQVVDYDHVKRLMMQRTLREDDNTEAGRKKHRDRVQLAVKRARIAMMHIKVVGCHDPFIWWTGKPVQGIRAMQARKQDNLFDRNDPGPEFPDD